MSIGFQKASLHGFSMSGCLILAASSHAQLSLATVEPDDYPVDRPVTRTPGGAILSVAGYLGDPVPGAAIHSHFSPFSSTGGRVFARKISDLAVDADWYLSPSPTPSVLRVDFPKTTDFASIDVVRPGTGLATDGGSMMIHDDAGRLLTTALIHLPPEAGSMKTMSLSRPTPDMAYVLIAGQPATATAPWSSVILDRLQYHGDLANDPGVPVQLATNAESRTTVTVSVSGVGSDSAPVAYTGVFLGWLRLDPTDSKISAGQLAPSHLYASDITLNVPPAGNVLLQVTGRGVRATLTSLGRPFAVDSQGTIAPDGLRATLDAGVVELSWFSPGMPPVISTVDYGVSPEPLPVSAAATVTMSPLSADEFGRSWTVHLRQPVHESITQDLGGRRLTITETGMIAASGSITARTAYGRWLEEKALPDVPFADPNPRNGLPNGILFALKIDPVAGAQLPWHADPDDSHAWRLALPAGGTSAVVVVEANDSLHEGGWAPATPAEMSTGSATLPLGSTGLVRIVGQAGRRFFRLKARMPEE